MQPNPGAVSGPGALSKRTDLPPSQGAMKLPNAAYGEQAQFQADQGGARMAASAKQNPPSLIGMGAETTRPQEPVTAGAASGPGPGQEILGIKNPVDTQVEDLSILAQYMPLMMSFADSPQSSGTMKAFVKYLRSQTS